MDNEPPHDPRYDQIAERVEIMFTASDLAIHAIYSRMVEKKKASPEVA